MNICDLMTCQYKASEEQTERYNHVIQERFQLSHKTFCLPQIPSSPAQFSNSLAWRVYTGEYFQATFAVTIYNVQTSSSALFLLLACLLSVFLSPAPQFLPITSSLARIVFN